MSLWQHLSEQISQHTQQTFKINSHIALSGGCINNAYKVSDGRTSYFVKTNDIKHGDMFKTESISLDEIQTSGCICAPTPICYGSFGYESADQQSYLVLEHLHLDGNINSVLLGQQLAAMHKTISPRYGWRLDNTIGSTPQYNQPGDNWLEFWRDQRLIPQLQLAEKNGYASSLSIYVEKLLDQFHHLFESYTPQPSMLHGDLWGGNAAALSDGTPVIFDPAFYYGDREADIAMTHLFGGFDRNFYAAYNEAWPLDDGFRVRKTFYNLYHIINHLNLFGSAYLDQAVSMTRQVLAEV